MIINWKKQNAGLLVVSVIDKKGNITRTITLMPGHNEITDDLWENIKVNSGVNHHIDGGNLIEVMEIEEMKPGGRTRIGKDGEEKKVVKTTKSIHKMFAKTAREIIQDTWDLPTLEKWLDGEGRDEIRAVIYKQIEKINNPKPNNKEDK